jgi:membrane-bound serine protease (ClpP class)
MILLVALVLSLVLLPYPWYLATIGAALVWEVATAVVGLRLSRHRRAQVGVETLLDATGEAITPLRPAGQVRLNGEIWQARSRPDAGAGERVRVTGIDRLTLEVEPLGEAAGPRSTSTGRGALPS